MKRKHGDSETAVVEKSTKKTKSSDKSKKSSKKTKDVEVQEITATALDTEIDPVEAEEQTQSPPQSPAPETESSEQKDPASTSLIVSKAPRTSKKVAAPRPSWDDYTLDPRLLLAIAEQKFEVPTLVQSKVLPLALEGHDILARSKTGSGKTAAYLLPIIQSLLTLSDSRRRTGSQNAESVSTLILVPTRELAAQVTKNIQSLISHCGKSIRVENLARKEDERVQKARLASMPDIVVSTPGRLISNINNSNDAVNKTDGGSGSGLDLQNLKHLVIDEADLIFSYGYEDDLKLISSLVPITLQHFFMSATLRTEEDFLKGMFCRRGEPKIIELDDEDKGEDKENIAQYVVECAEDEKFLLLYALFKLKLLRGKTIVFVGDIDRCYRLKLFLEQFGIKSCVLNSELPVNSRIHVVEQFNKGVYDIIIASDEHEVMGQDGKGSHKKVIAEAEEEGSDDEAQTKRIEVTAANTNVEDQKLVSLNKQKGKGQNKKQEQKRKQQVKEYGISRGIDFKNVSCVLNFDLPTSSKSYLHRIGRTGRGNQTGMALSFVVPNALYRKHKPTSFWSCEHDETVLSKISKSQEKRGHTVQPYHFDMAALEGFRYRLRDALKSVTSIAVREARVRELKMEILNSEVLKQHFDENPDELKQLRHDTELLRPAQVMPHLKHVPDYLLPKGMRKDQLGVQGGAGFVSFHKPDSKRRKLTGRKGGKKSSNNPLQNLKGRVTKRKV